MSFEQTKAFWDQQAETYGTSAQATTNDFYMRQIEIRCLDELIGKLAGEGATIADIGCGNGYSTMALAKKYNNHTFYGCDYSEGMIDSAKVTLANEGLNNTNFGVFDLTQDTLNDTYDIAYTMRCLINLPTWEAQKTAFDKIHSALSNGGHYIMIENFMDGQNNFNALRRQFGLSEINVRHHNLFFEKEAMLDYISDKFEVVEHHNISSQYYLVSRIVYSSICIENGESPDYHDIHHKLGSMLPFQGNNGPIQLYHLKKK